MPCPQKTKSQAGLTLFEVLLAIALLSIVLLGLQQVLSTSLNTYQVARDRQDILDRASFALERMVCFVRKTDQIVIPEQGNDTLKVSERVLNTYNNEDHSFKHEGDEYLDADNDHDQMVNEDDTDNPDADDPYEYVTFSLSGDQLLEEIPDYGTEVHNDTKEARTLCDNVVKFLVSRTNSTNSTNSTLLEIELGLETGGHNSTLKTRVRPRLVK